MHDIRNLYVRMDAFSYPKLMCKNVVHGQKDGKRRGRKKDIREQISFAAMHVELKSFEVFPTKHNSFGKKPN